MNEFDDEAEEVRSYVRSRMRGDLPPQFVEDVMRDVNRTPQRGRGGMGWPLVGGLATVAAAVAAVAISLSVIGDNQFGSDATPTPSISATPSASVAPSASAQPSASSPGATGEPSPASTAAASASSSPDGALAKDTIGRVVVTDLVVRSAPSVGDDSRILEMGLTDGDLVYVIEGPVSADGYNWLLVTQLAPEFASRAAGWIAPASREGEVWVAPSSPDCPIEVSVAAFAPVPPPLLLYCFGGQELTLEGISGSCAHGDPVIQEPEWLTNYFCSFEELGRPDGSTDWPSISVHTEPGVVLVPDGEPQPLRITGRFDSPAAETCRFIDEAEQIMPELGETDELFLRFNCRAAFVVESAMPIDP